MYLFGIKLYLFDKIKAFLQVDRDKENGYAGCQTLRFTSSILQETTYEMLVEDARIKLHKKAAVFLEKEACSCEVSLQTIARKMFV